MEAGDCDRESVVVCEPLNPQYDVCAVKFVSLLSLSVSYDRASMAI